MTQYSLLVVFKCVRPVYILADVFDRQQRRWQLVFAELYNYSFFQKNPKVFDLPLFTIFGFKNSHGFYNTKIFYADFFGWSNWLNKVVYCTCTISFNATLSSQRIVCVKKWSELKGWLVTIYQHESLIYAGVLKIICKKNDLEEPIQLLRKNKVQPLNDATSFFHRVNKHRLNFRQCLKSCSVSTGWST